MAGTYYYRVAAMTAEGMGAYSDGTASGTIDATPLDAPMLTATPGDGSVMLTWNEQALAVKYTVWGVRPDGSAVRAGSTDPLIRVDNITGTSHTVMDLMSGEDYWFVVTACATDACGDGEYFHSNVQVAAPN